MGGALRRLESPHEVASFSVDLWPWEWNSDHQQSSAKSDDHHQSQISPTDPLEGKEATDAVNDLGCTVVELVK